MKIWRVAILSGGIVSVGLLLLFAYQYFILDNIRMIEGLNEKFGSTIIPIMSMTVYVFIFVVTLVSFPSFLIKSIPWFLLPTQILLGNKPDTKELNKNDILSLFISSIFIFLLVSISVYVQQKNI